MSKKTGRRLRWVLGTGVVLALLCAVVLPRVLATIEGKSRTTAAVDRVKQISLVVSNTLLEIPSPARKLTGRNWVLQVVASGAMDMTDHAQRSLLFARGSDELLPARAYADVSWETLASRRFPHLTDLAGPSRIAGDHSDYTANLNQPVVADIGIREGIAVGWQGGRVEFYTWDDLGLERPDGSLVLGEAATHPLLRALSID